MGSVQGQLLLRLDTRSLQSSSDDGRTWTPIGAPSNTYLPELFGVSTSSPDNTAAWNELVATIRGSLRGGTILLGSGTYDLKGATTDPGGSPIATRGMGAAMTFIRAAGALVTTGDMFTPKRYWAMSDLTTTSTTARADGSYFRIVGDMLIGDIPSSPLQNYDFVGVNMLNGYEGVTLVDGPGSKGVCGFFWDGRYNHIRGFAAGGCPFVINSPNGTVNKLQNVLHSETAGVAAVNRPRATVHMTGAADFRMMGVENVYTVRGWHVDPPASGRVATVFNVDCIWGQNTSEAVRIAPNATADCHTIEQTGGYVDTGGMTIVGAAAKALVVTNMSFLGNTPNDALRLDGVVGSFIGTGLNFSGINAKCFHALNNSRNFKIEGQFSNVFGNNTLGIHIEVGCDKYQVNMVGAEYCTTPHSKPVDDATKVTVIF